MPTIRFALSEEDCEILEQEAKDMGCSIQEYIRMKLFNKASEYTASKAVEKALTSYQPGQVFSLPDLYPDWDLPRGRAGAFGKQFYAYVEDQFSDKIKYYGYNNTTRRAEYIML